MSQMFSPGECSLIWMFLYKASNKIFGYHTECAIKLYSDPKRVRVEFLLAAIKATHPFLVMSLQVLHVLPCKTVIAQAY